MFLRIQDLYFKSVPSCSIVRESEWYWTEYEIMCHSPGDEKWARHWMSSTLLSRHSINLRNLVFLGNQSYLMAVRWALKIWYSLRVIIYKDLTGVPFNMHRSFATSSVSYTVSWLFTGSQWLSKAFFLNHRL